MNQMKGEHCHLTVESNVLYPSSILPLSLLPTLVLFEEDLCKRMNGSMKLEQSLSEGTVLAMGKYVRQLRFVIGGWEWLFCF
jgi:hypothetical protein